MHAHLVSCSSLYSVAAPSAFAERVRTRTFLWLLDEDILVVVLSTHYYSTQ